METQREKSSTSEKEVRPSDLLTIQKFILLLSDDHYREFKHNLAQANALLPARLADAIRHQLPAFDSPEVLCTKVYGQATTADKKKFNQLTAHTFRLSFYLACNYPDYLAHNILLIEQLVNRGEGKQAVFLAQAMLDIAERTGDFRSQVWCLSFLEADASLHRDFSHSIKLYKQLLEVLTCERLTFEIQQQSQLDSTDEMAPKNDEQYERGLNYYRQYLSHTSLPVRIHAHYAYILWVGRYNRNQFSRAEDEQVLKTLEREMDLHPYLVFPFLTNLRGNTGFIRLHKASGHLAPKEKRKLFTDLEEFYSKVKFTSRFINGGHLYLLAAECSRLMNLWHTHIYRSDYPEIVPPSEREIVQKNVARCVQMLTLKTERKSNEVFLANLQMLYGAFLLLSGGEKHIRQAIDEIESLLILYQQMSLRSSTDSVFMVLMIAYFSVGDYEGCSRAYVRYNKVKKKKNIYEGNDERINAYYFLSQWLHTHRQQYLVKLRELLLRNGPDKVTAGYSEMLQRLGIDLLENVQS